jgi:hypothetical protein
MDDQNLVEALELRIKHDLEIRDSEDLLVTLTAAEHYLSHRKDLLFEAFTVAGEFRFGQTDYYNSILYYNKARKYNPASVIVFDRLIANLSAYYDLNKDKFIKSDLIKLPPSIKMLMDYYGNMSGSDQSVRIAEDLLSRIAYRCNYVAPEAIEGKETYTVSLIVDAIQKDVPMEQVRKEVSKFIADLIKKKKLKDMNATDTPKKEKKK